MFILIVSRGYPQPGSPLRGIFEFDQAKALTNAGHKVVFLSVDLRSIRRKRKLGKAHLHKDGIEIFNTSVPVGRVPAWLFLRIGRMALKSLYQDVIRVHGKPDVIHAHFSDTSAMASIVARDYNMPFVVTEHSSLINKERVDAKTLYFAKNCYPNADRLITVSSKMVIRIKQHFDVDSMMIPNIVDLMAFHFQPVSHDDFCFVSVGSLFYNKGFDVLINAFSKIKFANCKLVIIGKGTEREKLAKLIAELELEDRVNLIGQRSREEINVIFNQADAFVLTSRSETFGVVFIEAMAAGLPVITTRCGGPEDFVNESNGMLVDVDNVKQITQAMEQMVVSINRFDKKRISEDCMRNFSPEVIAEMLGAVYSGLVGCD